jgi:hypothetical protein
MKWNTKNYIDVGDELPHEMLPSIFHELAALRSEIAQQGDIMRSLFLRPGQIRITILRSTGIGIFGIVERVLRTINESTFFKKCVPQTGFYETLPNKNEPR